MSVNKIIQSILNMHYADYAKQHKQPVRVLKAVESQQQCRTAAQGVNYYRCPEDGERKEVYHSCRHRGCTVCGKRKQHQWLESQKKRLLNCEHFHLVFTIPHEYLALWRYNRKWFIDTLFKVVNETLNALLQGNQHQGKTYSGSLEALTGAIAVLHTWGRSLNLHPHLHLLLTAGGLNGEGHWKGIEDDYLLPVKLVKSLYRGKFQARIKDFINSDEVRLPKGETVPSLLQLHHGLYQKEWSVRIQEKYEQGNGVLIYLSRYLGGLAVKPEQIKLINHDKEILFTYWSHRDQRQKQQRLSFPEFLKKYLEHQPEPHVHTVRYYGLYGSQGKKKRAVCEEHLGKTVYQKETLLEGLVQEATELLCSCCGAIMELISVSRPRPKLKIPLYSVSFTIKGSLEGILPPIRSG